MTAFWTGRRVLVTGHTGFKGAWLCLWLQRLGATVSGLALPPQTKPSLYELASPWSEQDHRTVDIRDFDTPGCRSRCRAASYLSFCRAVAGPHILPRPSRNLCDECHGHIARALGRARRTRGGGGRCCDDRQGLRERLKRCCIS